MKTLEVTQEKIDIAIYESIYWWNRSEAYYYSFLHRLDEIYVSKELYAIFSVKTFQVFLREYSVRWNIAEGTESVDLFIDQLFQFGFFEEVKNGKVEIIDSVSNFIKQVHNSSTKHRHSVSLLSKIAFLINPHKFVLYDALAKKSLYALCQNEIERKSKLETYIGFYEEAEKFKSHLEKQNYFKNAYRILEAFPDTKAYHFFSKEVNREAFKRRILDKYLWLEQQKESFSRQQFLALSNF